jgi:hypothetical protein
MLRIPPEYCLSTKGSRGFIQMPNHANRSAFAIAVSVITVIIAWISVPADAGVAKSKDAHNMKPRFFDIRASDVSNEGVPVLKAWRRITLDPRYAGAWIGAGVIQILAGTSCITMSRVRFMIGTVMATMKS